MRRARQVEIHALALLVALVLGSAASAQTARPASDAAAARNVCVDVDVNGVRTPSYDCLSRKLQAAAVPEAGASSVASERLATQPSNRVGTFNLSGERNRFGSNWGTSSTPQRPAAPVVVPPR